MEKGDFSPSFWDGLLRNRPPSKSPEKPGNCQEVAGSFATEKP